MTNMLHRASGDAPFVNRLKEAELRYVASSQAAARCLAENYVGLPFSD
jgi:p-hydroxybenzoate 3-monooxygenase